MNHRIAMGVASVALSLGLCGAANAQAWTSINQRERLLDDRIDAGVTTGQLTPDEAARLRADYRGVVALENRYRAGGLSAWERRDLDRRFDRLTANIRSERRDGQTFANWFGRPGWLDQQGRWMPVNARQRELDRRIDRGLRAGRLTRHEAENLRQEYRRIARLERRYQRGGLSSWERADLDHRFDRLATNISDEATDNQWGYGYGPQRR
jgi:hypothetical protein